MSTGETLVREFSRMVARDGGQLQLLDEDGGVVRVGYRPGIDPTCDEGACVLPHLELQQLMNETLTRRDPHGSVVVELIA